MARKRIIPARQPSSAPASPPRNTTEMGAANTADCQRKIDNLKALNDLLVKETMESREQILQLRATLESFFADNCILATLEKDSTSTVLCAQLASVRDRWSKDCIERGAVLTGALEQARKEKDEVEEARKVVVAERDAMRVELEGSKEEQRVMQIKFDEMVMKAEVTTNYLRSAQEECAALKDENKEKDEAFRSLLMDKTTLEMTITDLTQSIKLLKNDMQRAVQEKEGEIQAVRTEMQWKVEHAQEDFAALQEQIRAKDTALQSLSMEKSGLERRVSELTQTVEGLKKDLNQHVQEREEELQEVRTKLGLKVEDAEEAYTFLEQSPKCFQERIQDAQMQFEIKLRVTEMKIKEMWDALRTTRLECLSLKDMIKEKDAAFQSLSTKQTAFHSRIADLTHLVEELQSDKERAVRDREGELETVSGEFGRKVKDAEEALLKQSEKQLLIDLTRQKMESKLLRREGGSSASSKLSQPAKTKTELNEAAQSSTEVGEAIKLNPGIKTARKHPWANIHIKLVYS